MLALKKKACVGVKACVGEMAGGGEYPGGEYDCSSAICLPSSSDIGAAMATGMYAICWPSSSASARAMDPWSSGGIFA
jgi:hypothetical protein